MPDFNNMREVNACLLIFSALVVLFLLIGAIADYDRIRPFMKSFIRLLIADIIMQLGEAGMWIFAGSPENIPLLKLCCVMSFGAGYLLIGLYAYCLLEFGRERAAVSMLPAHIMAVACGIMFLLVIVSAFNGMFFAYDDQGRFLDGPYAWVVNLFDIITFLVEVCLIIRYWRLFTIRELLPLLSFCILPFCTMLMMDVWYPTPEYLATTLSLIMVFVLFHRKLVRRLAEQEKELAESRIAIMISQIQPHFLYNSLNTIYYLCKKDAAMAQQAIKDFSEYLQWNLNSIKRREPIPFEEELKHVKAYLQLEQLRFGKRLNVIYHIETTHFLLPALSIQPLVENAVKHGICHKKEGGTVIITAKECPECHEITIEDDGAGFDPERKPEDGKLHVGIENVRQRLFSMCSASLTIESEPGKGTIVRICIPK